MAPTISYLAVLSLLLLFLSSRPVMKCNTLKTLVIFVGLILLPSVLHAWCWIRNTGRTSQGCGTSSLVMEQCCSGALRRWAEGTMPYHISSVTPDTLIASMQTGVDLWNNVEMSSFTFDYQGTSHLTAVSLDGINLISIDGNFATNKSMTGQGVLAISTTWSVGRGGVYRAIESDIVFNGEEYAWGDGSDGTIDTAAVVAHEAGHSAGLSHAGAECQNPGSEGCGANFEEATMYWNYAAGTPGMKDKGSLELDDAAALIHGYPKSTFTVKVQNSLGAPISGATVALLGAAAPRDGGNNLQGGVIYGDITNGTVLMGDRAPSESYVNQTPFDPTDASGLTNAIHPTHRSFQVRVAIAGLSETVSHTLADGPSTLIVTLPGTLTHDDVPPIITATTPSGGISGASVKSAVSVQFNEAMAPDTLNTDTFTNAQGLSGSVTYDAESRTATFTPDSSLAYLTTYTFSLTTGAKDAAGNPLASHEEWSFTTQAEPSSSGEGGGCFIRSTQFCHP